MIYLVANTKGGVGKSTIAVNLAAWLSKTSKTLLIDADKQESAKSWMIWRREKNMPYNPNAMALYDQAVLYEGRVFAADYDNVVVDAGGRDNNSLRFALLLADKVIAPISTSNFDTGAWEDFNNAFQTAKSANTELELCVVMTRIHPGRSEKRTNDLRDFMEKKGVHVLNATIPEAVAFVDTIEEGMGVFERDADDRATHSIKKFFKEVI